jgi:hypothetical protein
MSSILSSPSLLRSCSSRAYSNVSDSCHTSLRDASSYAPPTDTSAAVVTTSLPFPVGDIHGGGLALSVVGVGADGRTTYVPADTVALNGCTYAHIARRTHG